MNLNETPQILKGKLEAKHGSFLIDALDSD
jgi:hypothetical protein